MVIGVVWILVAALVELGGLSAANRALAELDPTLLSAWGRDLGHQGQWGIVLGAVLVFSVGYMGWPHVVTRHMAMQRPATARLAGAYSTGWNLLFVSSPYLLGILAILILPDLADPEMAIFEVARKLLPAAVTGIVMAAIMAAIMSTADSLLLQTGSIAARDLYERFINPRASQRQMVWVARLMVLAIGLFGYIVALVEPPTVFGIVVFVTTVLGSAFLPAYVCAVWWRRANAPGALASMVTGAGVAFIWQFASLDGPSGLHPMLAGLLGSTLAMVLVSLATQRRRPLPQPILDMMAEASRLGPIERSPSPATSSSGSLG